MGLQRLGRRPALVAWLTAGAWLEVAALWLLDVTGHGLGTWLSKIWLGLAVVATLGLIIVLCRALLGVERRAWGGWLLVVVGLAMVVGFGGLDHEVGKGYYTDEGHYLHRAQLVNSGQVFHRSMIYPHLLYYRDGLALWIAGLFPRPVEWLASTVYGVDDPPAIPWLVLRWATALMGALTVVPVFLLARRLAGLPAAGVASLLMIFSAHFHDGFHVNICDAPSATFAAVAFYLIGRLAEEERTQLYLWAGVAAGLAAASKYPAGVVAVGIVGIWIVHRVRQRNFKLGLLWAGLISLATFVALNPSLLVYPDATLFGDRGLFFGVRQYSQGGWIGVMPSSNTGYYWQQLQHNFGWAVFPAAVVGLFGLASSLRWRLLNLSVFPIAFMFLIGSMNMVVVRNLFPLIPALAVLLGVAASGLAGLAQRFLPRRRAWGLAWGVIALVLLPTIWRTTRQTVAMTQPSTRELMSDWMMQHVPRGASLLKESYTPNFQQVWFPNHELRFLIRFPPEALVDPGSDFALLASQAHGRFFRTEHQTEMQADWYRQFFADNTLMHEVSPSTLRLGPKLLLYRLDQADPAEAAAQPRVILASQAFLPNPNLQQGEAIVFRRQGQFALFKTHLVSGPVRIVLQGERLEGFVLVRDPSNREVARVDLVDGAVEVSVGEHGKYFVYLYLNESARVEGVEFQGAGALLADSTQGSL